MNPEINSEARDKNRTAVWARPAVWLLCAGAIGTVVFAAALAFKLIERRQDRAYYDSLAASFNTPNTPAASADAVVTDTN